MSKNTVTNVVSRKRVASGLPDQLGPCSDPLHTPMFLDEVTTEWVNSVGS
jgi:hypothetical protein